MSRGSIPPSLSAGIGNLLIAAVWTDIDTRNSAGQTSPGGDSTGTNLVYYDLDTVNGVLTLTWNDAGQFANHTVPNAFQIQLVSRGSEDFDRCCQSNGNSSPNWRSKGRGSLALAHDGAPLSQGG